MVKGFVVLLVLVALGIGGIAHFVQVFGLIVVGLCGVIVLGGGTMLVITYRSRRRVPPVTQPVAPPMETARVQPRRPVAPSEDGDFVWPTEPTTWSARTIRERLGEIDWYQFEKFCAALLEADGFEVERRGGAQPDGGVDLLVEKHGARALIQCKHWRNWRVQERTVRELLGSMTAMKTAQGAIYTLAGWTEPAAEFAAKHDITLVNGDELAASAELQLAPEHLERLLDTSVHHCPKCEAPMVWRTGSFTPFWGCSRYPRCRGKLNHSGAK